MNKQELVDAIVTKNPEITKKAAGEAINATLEAISEALAKGDSVQLIGFGTFEVRTTKARTGRNPSTGAPLNIAAGKKVGFKVGKALKDLVAG
jgi:nucleoid DNA-binding protein